MRRPFVGNGAALLLGLTETAVASLVVTAVSSDQDLVPDGNLVVGGADAARTITATPVGDSSGVATITVTVDDGTDTSQEQFVLTVGPVNYAPSFAASDPPAAPNGLVATANGSAQIPNISLTGNDLDEAPSG